MTALLTAFMILAALARLIIHAPLYWLRRRERRRAIKEYQV